MSTYRYGACIFCLEPTTLRSTGNFMCERCLGWYQDESKHERVYDPGPDNDDAAMTD